MDWATQYDIDAATASMIDEDGDIYLGDFTDVNLTKLSKADLTTFFNNLPLLTTEDFSSRAHSPNFSETSSIAAVEASPPSTPAGLCAAEELRQGITMVAQGCITDHGCSDEELLWGMEWCGQAVMRGCSEQQHAEDVPEHIGQDQRQASTLAPKMAEDAAICGGYDGAASKFAQVSPYPYDKTNVLQRPSRAQRRGPRRRSPRRRPRLAAGATSR